MIFVKFVMTNGFITVDEEQAKAILRSENQLVPIKDLKGQWTYETLNKAYIIRTQLDYEKIREWNNEKRRQEEKRKIAEENARLLAMSPEERKALEEKEIEMRKKMKEMFDSFRVGNK